MNPSGSELKSNPELDKIFGKYPPPDNLKTLLGGTGNDAITRILSTIVELLYIFAALVLLYYLFRGALQFIYSEGEKEALSEARGKITWALIGFIILALVFPFLKILGHVIGFKFFG